MLFAFVVVFTTFENVFMCNEEICLTWKIAQKSLIITCTVPKASLRISIIDPTGFTQAYCIPSLRICETSRDKRVIFSAINKDILFTLPLKLENTWNGTWKCLHGVRRNVAKTSVSFTESKGPSQTLVTTSIMQTITTTDNRTEEQIEYILRTYFGALTGLLIFLFVVLAVCNMFISRKCISSNIDSKPIAIGDKVPQTVIDVNERNNVSYQQDNISEVDEYETINEADIIQHLGISKHNTNVDVNLQINSSQHVSTLSASSSSSGNLYLDVIDSFDYRNTYERVLPRDKDDQHYTITDPHCKCVNETNLFDQCEHHKTQTEHQMALSLDRRQLYNKNKSLQKYHRNSCPEIFTREIMA